MPPQFFKDAHSVLNNKFVPRSFALNLNVKENSDGGSSGDQSFGSPSESSVTPRATSTAPSTGSSSRFFGAYPGGKERHDHNDDILEDSSMENFENMVQPQPKLKNDQGSEERRVVSTGRSSTSGSDVLEITDVREVTQVDQSPEYPESSKHDNQSHTLDNKNQDLEYQAAETSADLIMEALVKSQRLCSQYKQKLAKAESRIASQEEEIQSSKTSVLTLKLSVKKSQDLLSVLESRSKTFYESHKEEGLHSSSIKQEIKSLLENIEQQKNENLSLKKKFEYLKQIKVSTGYEIEKKKLDETSGLLSEQKIKCSELEKKLETCRKDYDQKLDLNLKENERVQEGLRNSLTEFKNEIIENLYSLKLNEEGINTHLTNNEKSQGEMASNLTSLREYLKPKMEKVNADQAFVNSICTQVLDEFKQLVNDVKRNHSQTSEIENSCKNVVNSLESLEDKIKQNNVNSKKVADLMESNKSNEKEISELKLKLGEFHTEKQLLSKEIETLNQDILKIKSERDESLKKFQKKSEEHEKYITQSELKANKSKTTSESKLRTQMEIHKLIGEERDKLKQELEFKNTDLTGLQNELISLKTTLMEKEKLITNYETEKSRNDQSYKDIEAEITKLKEENKRLCDSIDAQLNLSTNYPQKKPISVPAPASQESTNDLELTASFQELNRKDLQKPITVNLKPGSLKSKPVDSKKKTIVSKYSKRKKLLEDDEGNLFDSFDFEETGSDHATAPKRYTKRRKTSDKNTKK
ncbi:Myosin [Wickerhamomyces ciferrii]|uniref:Myosin n=1 Tax=Wickerhamomyces ciferrii (strain ATCC 14091 / BCRC 22168 / CBS 111 / JCM 3599 / NBRC 0793 / NRRL Y-1031 F-60-10) TaxID=1206466 RepID=K0KWN7_WICCF|nr:Myosin [Wickerhamomyces ciferrii]CCH46442.1 Myosin [Wickerhamomyces ciferrii]